MKPQPEKHPVLTNEHREGWRKYNDERSYLGTKSGLYLTGMRVSLFEPLFS